MNRKNITTILIILFLTAAAVSSEPSGSDAPLLSFEETTSHLTVQDRQALLESGELFTYHNDNFLPGLVPEGIWKDRINREVRKGGLNLGLEGLFLYQDFNPEILMDNPDEVLLKLYNRLQAVNTLEGIEYYSASRKKMRVLFEESWRIPDPEEPKDQLADKLDQSLSSQSEFYIHQKDTTFGDSESLMTLYYDDPVISTELKNQSNIRLAFIKVIDKDKLQIHLVILPTEEGLLFYAVMGADTVNIKKFKDIAQRSFENRIIALYKWYTADLNSIF